MSQTCADDEQNIDSECVNVKCITEIPMRGSKKCGMHGKCEGKGAEAQCVCNSGFEASARCAACTDTSLKPDLVNGGQCQPPDCRGVGQTVDCGGNGYCQTVDKAVEGKILCDCKPGFTGKYCDQCKEHYVDKDGGKCNACAEGYTMIETTVGTAGDKYITCYVNKCDPDQTNKACTLLVGANEAKTCVPRGEELVCSCVGGFYDKTFCKTCAPGYSLVTETNPETSVTTQKCISSDCWTESMDHECTSATLGRCLIPESGRPTCKCSPLTAKPASGIDYCSSCREPNMDQTKGCLCSMGYKLINGSGGFSCKQSSAVNAAVVKVRPECGALFNNPEVFLNTDGDFDYNKYSELYNGCACLGVGTATETSCTACKVPELDKDQSCAVCVDSSKRVFVGDSPTTQTVFCFEDKCTTGAEDCNGHGVCGMTAGETPELQCKCEAATGLKDSDRCRTCAQDKYIFAVPDPGDEEEEDKGERELAPSVKADPAPKPTAKCVPDNCTATTDTKQVCNNKGQCYLYFKEDGVTIESRCKCGELIDQCTACTDPKKHPYNTECYEHECNRVEVADPPSITYCNGHGTCGTLDNIAKKLSCTCKPQFTGKFCDACATGYVDYGSGLSTRKCLKCAPGYKATSSNTEGTESVTCFKNDCPDTGCNGDANPDNRCAISGTKWDCVCAKGYINNDFLASGKCAQCGKGYKMEKQGSITYCYPSTCTSDVFDPNFPMAPPTSAVECSNSPGITRGTCVKEAMSNQYHCKCNNRFIGDRCELCGYIDAAGANAEDQNMVSDADIAAGKYKADQICKCKEGFRFGDDGTGFPHCLANYCLVTKKECNNNPDTLIKNQGEWNKRMECCGVSGSSFSSDPRTRDDDVEELVQSDVCQLKNGSYRCLNCGNFSIFSANYKCAVCRDQIAGRAGVKVADKCLEDNCKKNCNGEGVCKDNGGKGQCECTQPTMDQASSCSRCLRPANAVMEPGKGCTCGDEQFAIVKVGAETCDDLTSFDPVTSNEDGAKCTPKDCGVGGNCYDHGTCYCVANGNPIDKYPYKIKFQCLKCDAGYTLESNCKDCTAGYRKGSISKTTCLPDGCTDPISKRLCNNLGTCTAEGKDKDGNLQTQCVCGANAERVHKGPPDCNTCVEGYQMRPSSTTCVLNICYPRDGEGMLVPNASACNGKGSCNYERAYNEYRCKCDNGLYGTESACQDCKENSKVGYQVRDPAAECKCIESKGLREHPNSRTCVPINCKQEGADHDCNGLGTCVAGAAEFECRCNAGEDPTNYCATCLMPVENEDGTFEYYSYPEIVTEGETEREICYLNNCERSKLKDDPTQCAGHGVCVKNEKTVTYECVCTPEYSPATQCKNCAEKYEMDPTTRICAMPPYKLPAAGYVGIVFGALLVIGVVLGVLYYRWKSKKIAEENERKITVDRTKTAQQPITVVTI